jgi:hypothetical protein
MKAAGYGTEVETELFDNAYSAKKVLDELLEAARAGDQNARQLLRDARDRLSSAIASSREGTRAANPTVGQPTRVVRERLPSDEVEKGRAKKKRSARGRARPTERHGG